MIQFEIHWPDAQAMQSARDRWDAIAKPLHSLGKLEDMIVQIAGIRQTADFGLRPRCVLVFCADHGVVEEGVSQSGSEVTALVAESIVRGDANINHMASVSGTDVFAVDMGMLRDVEGTLCRKTRSGTANMASGPAMTYAQAEQSLQAGIDLVGEMKNRGYQMVATGEMGIGNTTAATAVVCALLSIPPEEITGRGAGLSDAGLQTKVNVIQKALSRNNPDPNDPIDVLAKVGGLEIAGMAGAFLGGMTYRIPVVIDGVISAAAALVAAKLCPQAKAYMLPSHMSREGAAPRILRQLGLEPILFADLALGEGTGAVALFPLLDMAHRVYGSPHTFGTLGMDAYTPFGGNV